jgi:drug/metabolite transporter (DMT)-like permease
METYHPLTIVAYVTAPGGLFLIPLSLAENSLQKIFTLSLNSWFVILFLSLTCSLLGYYIWFDVVNKAGAALTSTFLFAEPLVTVLLAVIFVREEITLAIIAGGLLIFIGVYLVVKQQNLEKRYSKEKRYRTENRVPSHNE